MLWLLYCTVLYCTVLYCTVLYCTVLYCTVLYCTVLYCMVSELAGMPQHANKFWQKCASEVGNCNFCNKKVGNPNFHNKTSEFLIVTTK